MPLQFPASRKSLAPFAMSVGTGPVSWSPCELTQLRKPTNLAYFLTPRKFFRCASQPLAGKTYTLFPKKLGYFAYIFIFEVGSLLCALAPSSQALIVGRAIAGLGASGIFAGGFTVLTTVIPLHKRAIWTGTMSSVFAISSIIGPVIAGALTQSVTWRWCFWINVSLVPCTKMTGRN